MNEWNKSNIPHKGWRHIETIDLKADGQDESDYEVCQMCGQERIRYIHIMEHDDFEGEMRTGCVCAEKMCNDYITPKKEEAKLINRAKRRNNWLTRNWRQSYIGNDYLNVDGMNITIFRDKYNPSKWGYVISDGFSKKYSQKKFDSKDEAKLAAFDAI